MKLQHSAYIIASIFLLSSAVLAHPDWKSNAGTVASAPLRHWTGFYAGLNVGGVGHTMDVTDNQAVTFNATIRQASNPALTGGFQVGWRRQMDGTATTGVYGVEFSANIANAEFTQ